MIKQKKKICKTCGVDSYIFSKGNCKNCSTKQAKPIKRYSEKGLIKKEEKKEYTLKQFDLFREIYLEHPTKKCLKCNAKVNGNSSIQFHHCLYKSKYSQFALEKWNILLVCEDCHQLTHVSIEKTPKIKQYTEELKLKYL